MYEKSALSLLKVSYKDFLKEPLMKIQNLIIRYKQNQNIQYSSPTITCSPNYVQINQLKLTIKTLQTIASNYQLDYTLEMHSLLTSASPKNQSKQK